VGVVFAQSSLCLVERFEDAGFDVIGMQRIEQEQIPGDWILREAFDNSFAVLARFKDEFHDAFKSRAMDFHEKLDHLTGRNLGAALWSIVEFADQSAELSDFLLKFFFASHATPSPSAIETRARPK